MTLRDFSPDFNKNFSRRINNLANKLGFKATIMLSELAEQVASPQAKRALNSALDFLRPHLVSMGLRISILGRDQVEMTLPIKARNLDSKGRLLPGIQISAAVEAYKLLWQRNAPEGIFDIQILSVNSRFMNLAHGDLKIRGELSEIGREGAWAELRKNKRSKHQSRMLVFDQEKQMVAEIEIEAELFLLETLEWK